MNIDSNNALQKTLLRVSSLRVCLILAFIALLGFAHIQLDLKLYYIALAGLLSLYACLTFLGFLRARRAWQWPISAKELFFQLLIDVAFIGSVLYATGGASNPLITLLLIPLTISAAVLPFRLTLLIAISVVGLYSLLLFFFVSVSAITPHAHHIHSMDTSDNAYRFFKLHILGMWLTFAFSAALITAFVGKLAQNLRERNHALHQAREKILRHEQLVALGTQAAGTVHELATPLNSLTLLIENLQKNTTKDSELQTDLVLADKQIQQCKTTLQQLSELAQHGQQEQNKKLSISHYIDELIAQWQHLKPATHIAMSVNQNKLTEPEIDTNRSLSHAIINLIDNAADASSDKISINLSWTKFNWTLAIRDYGAGIDEALLSKLGEPLPSTKKDGYGLGIFIAHASIESFGGEVICQTNFDREGGTLMKIKLPVDNDH